MKIATILLAAALVACGQTPVISNITVTDVTHASVHVTFDLDTDYNVQIKYGLSSGTYIYASASVGTFSHKGSLSIGGLRPATTYYLRVTARPNDNNDTGICQTAGCGSTEQVLTTLPEPAVHPIPPESADEWHPTEVDTTGYTVIPMQVSGTDGQCVAAQNVTQHAGWTAAVNTGDTIQAILDKVFYGTVVEFPQGANCKVIETGTFFHNGYQLPAKTADTVSPHRWIVFRTVPGNPGDFPPFGVRTGPAWSAKMAKLVIQTPGMKTGGTNLTGQVFQSYNTDSHHFWFQNLELTNSTAAYTPLEEDPEMFTCPIQVEPLNRNPHHTVLDRLYIHSAEWPSRLRCGVYAGGDQFALLSSYVLADVWRVGRFPTANATASGGTITVPRSQWSFRANDTPYGMVTATTVNVAGTGSISCWIDAATAVTNGLTCRYSGLNSATCSACNIAPGSTQIPITALRILVATVSGGTATLVETANGSDTTTRYSSWQPLGVFLAAGNQKTFTNNYIQALGQTIYNDALEGRSFSNHVFVRNYLDFPRSKMQQSGQWDGYTYTFRNPLETKHADRWRIEGNIFNGSAAYQNAGWVLMTVGSYPGSGTKNILIRNNIFRHLAAGFQCAGGGGARPPDSPTARQIELSNNLWLDLDRDKYNNGGASLMSGPFGIYPGCEDVNIYRNTVDLSLGLGPSLLLVGAASDGTTVMGEGLNFTNNILHLSLNALMPIWSGCGQLSPTHPANPAPLCTTSDSNYKQLLDKAFVRAGTTVTPSYNFTRNVIIGGQTHRGQNSYTDMSQSMINDEKSRFPQGNIFPSGNTLAARRNAVKWDAKEYRTVPTPSNAGDIGANIDEIRSAGGVVQDIRMLPGTTEVRFNYTAPDTKTCVVDVGRGGTWSRVSDGGGARPRAATVSGLTPGQTYQYRILCYFEQAGAQEFTGDQLTSGTFSTSAQVARSIWVGTALASQPGAASMSVTLTPVNGGSATNMVCMASPCNLTVQTGIYTQTVQYLDINSQPVSPPDSRRLAIQ